VAGASITLNHKIDDKDVLAAFADLEALGADPTPILEDFGEYWLNNHQERWGDEKDPETSTPWAPLSEDYKKRKQKNAGKILLLETNLRDLLNYQVNGASLALGTPVEDYGAAHQFGFEKRNLPARPYLGMSPADAVELKATVLHHAGRALEK
jgi:phage gpG-like protein